MKSNKVVLPAANKTYFTNHSYLPSPGTPELCTSVLLQSMPEATIVTYAKFQVIGCNDGWEKIYDGSFKNGKVKI